ncbi:hypothetical protein D3C77_532740 [compost metagenome]
MRGISSMSEGPDPKLDHTRPSKAEAYLGPMPEAPNLFAAVTSTLPALCGVLAAFFSGYFAAVYVADSDDLKLSVTLTPYIFSDETIWKIEITRKTAILVIF